jgi:methionine-rich copper-binding protein CopC
LADSQRDRQVFQREVLLLNFKEPAERGFNIEQVKDTKGNPLSYTINQTMMRINLASPLKPGEKNFHFYY